MKQYTKILTKQVPAYISEIKFYVSQYCEQTTDEVGAGHSISRIINYITEDFDFVKRNSIQSGKTISYTILGEPWSPYAIVINSLSGNTPLIEIGYK